MGTHDCGRVGMAGKGRAGLSAINRFTAFLLAFVFLTASSAQALTISFSDQVEFIASVPPNEDGGGEITVDATFELPQFDPSLGTLHSMMLQLDTSHTHAAVYLNDLSTPRNMTIGVEDFIRILVPGTTRVWLGNTFASSCDLESVAEGLTGSCGGSGSPSPDSVLTGRPADSGFVGTGIQELQLAARIRTIGVSGGVPLPLVEHFTDVFAEVTVTYDFTPSSVPEPAVGALLALGLAVAIGRRGGLRSA